MISIIFFILWMFTLLGSLCLLLSDSLDAALGLALLAQAFLAEWARSIFKAWRGFIVALDAQRRMVAMGEESADGD